MFNVKNRCYLWKDDGGANHALVDNLNAVSFRVLDKKKFQTTSMTSSSQNEIEFSNLRAGNTGSY